ncbi:MAG: putative hydrolase (HAD superfamily) [Candidatus Accumulibacter adjunctus]|uniref:Hydrolase (HAD superfamily) n=1 Tax=Candidatus Accumulibacter adjunctus TaxID=1454001 RepID=A0A011MBZ7_9PROT|nr:MAG: putative hydrolase (HAD superfamily) [Candidatus Accumulibacter adjunctus]
MSVGEASRCGAESLGPVFTGWAHLLLRAARRRKLQRLFFVARDGYLLQQVTVGLLKALGRDGEFDLAYLHLSRRATQLAANPTIDRAGVTEAMAIRARTPTVASLLAYHGMAVEEFAALLHGLGLAPELRVKSTDHGASLLRHEAIRNLLATESGRQRQALLAYLEARGVLRDENSALIDIGWRGSIQRNLARILTTNGHRRLPPWIYLGLWRDDSDANRLPVNAEGLLGDLRRGRTLRESAPWQTAFLLEAACRKDEGSVLRFVLSNGRGMPELAPSDSPARLAERQSEPLSEALRKGILDYIASSASAARWERLDDEVLRQEAQDQLLRLAFQPTAAEIALGEALVHTESHAPDWSTPLVLPRIAGPLSAPGQWLAGLASPWRGAYVKASGGWPLALAHRGLESLLVRMPPALRIAVRRAALVVAGNDVPTT